MAASANGGTQKFMVCKGKSYESLDDLGVPPFQETSMLFF